MPLDTNASPVCKGYSGYCVNITEVMGRTLAAGVCNRSLEIELLHPIAEGCIFLDNLTRLLECTLDTCPHSLIDLCCLTYVHICLFETKRNLRMELPIRHHRRFASRICSFRREV
jgi:hypothetical protein